MKSQVVNKYKKLFGKSNEQLNSDQISLFDEAEKYIYSKSIEPTIEEIPYKRKKSFSKVENVNGSCSKHKKDNESTITPIFSVSN